MLRPFTQAWVSDGNGSWPKRIMILKNIHFQELLSWTFWRYHLKLFPIQFKQYKIFLTSYFAFLIFGLWPGLDHGQNYFLAHERDPLVDVPDRLHHRSMNVPRGFLNVQSPFSTFSIVCDLFKARKVQKLSWNVQEWSERVNSQGR